MIAVSGGGWGVGDLVGATRAALEVPDALVLCLCGRNDDLRRRVAQRFPDEPRLRLMGFTDRMGDVLAAADALVHSSAGLTVLEAIIRGCPVISYGFGVGHVRASNRGARALRAGPGRAQGVRPRSRAEAGARAASRARRLVRPAALDRLADPELTSAGSASCRAGGCGPTQAVTGAAVLIAVLGWTLTTGASYQLVSHFVHMRAVTAVSTARPEVGVLIDAPSSQLPTLASALSADGMHVSFAFNGAPASLDPAVFDHGNQAVPRLPGGGLVRWLKTRGELHRLLHEIGLGRHFLYASSGPSIGQWWLAHRAGGRLIAGAVRVDDHGDSIGRLRPGEVIEISTASAADALPVLSKLHRELQAQRLSAVPVGRLMRDAGVSV